MQVLGPRISASGESLADHRAHFTGFFATLREIRNEPAQWKTVETRDVELNKNLRARVYIPPDTPVNGELPVGLYIHSGGWYTGSVDAEDFLCRNISYNSRIILISPEYRLAPESPFPAGLDDCAETYEFLHAHAAEFGGSSRHKYIMGGSAGGNLTACVALRYASDPELRPSGAMVSCMTSCDPGALPAKYRERYTPDIYRETPVINASGVETARGKLKAYHIQNPCIPRYWSKADSAFFRMAIAPTTGPSTLFPSAPP